ncbi:hypothetical protein [Streptomyces sp. NPDC057582]|uniref:hypothetical protein n=1 Tax=Streptomyces sp. NPDC057582 TaxID=3346174 RepID=UPI0036761310
MGVDVARGQRSGGAPCGLDVPLRLAFALGFVLEPSGERHPAQVQDAHCKVTVGRAERADCTATIARSTTTRPRSTSPKVEVGARAVAGTERLGDGVGLLLDALARFTPAQRAGR